MPYAQDIYPADHPLFQRNPVCALCWRECMAMCEEWDGQINFDLLGSMEVADRLCRRLIANAWTLSGVEYYYHWLEGQLGFSRPAVTCATAVVCLTLRLMDGLNEGLHQLGEDMRGLLWGEAGELYDNLRSEARRQDICLDATNYGEIPPDPEAEIKAENENLKYENYQLKQQLRTMAKQEPTHQTNIYNYGTYNDIHDNPNATIYTAPQDSSKGQLMPQEGDYSALVKWLELEKQNGKDYLADADFNRSKMCRNLLKIIGWEPNQDSLRKAQSR